MRSVSALAAIATLAACTAENPQAAGVPVDEHAGLRSALFDVLGRVATLEDRMRGLLAAPGDASRAAVDALASDVAALGERVGRMEAKQSGSGAKQPHLVASDGADLGVYVDRCTGAVNVGGKVALTQWCVAMHTIYDDAACSSAPWVTLVDRDYTTGNLSARYVSHEGRFLSVVGRPAKITQRALFTGGKCVAVGPQSVDAIPVVASAGGARSYSPDDLHAEWR